MPKVLSVEDDELMIHEILSSLCGSGYEVDVARCGRDGIARIMAFPYDLVTLDRTLPDLDGLTILTAMRDVGIDTPVLLVSSMSNVDERVRGLRAGGDDYLTKPFAREEMVARAEVLLRRKTPALNAETRLQVGELEFDLLKRKASHHGQTLDLQPTELKLLEYMMRHPGQVLTRTMIFEGVWGCRFDPGTNLIDVHVGRLRKKVSAAGENPQIRTVRGSGYILS
ncbi:response regulator transcription factor [Paraburkholderia phenazinium]|jgi:two-component system OmpR family response regulator|uniref:DNA-binding response regulator, OmpR family, contains REC and winged-helix (WHTH) domain n=1 Tax=Paraburkholderia phenazinium TaxID=60549 RepID=A0A1G8GQ13_9BURK|nr:response regulator transcription factor [Paraburkholderia phenazinium]SDH96351.1 DNA-binding response regulator, OmpR family, contains REC and winged-helix (wHTH) domain [Paraburkholderia phenazinium]